MTPRQIIRSVLDGGVPPYTPWSFSFTVEAADKLREHFAPRDVDDVLGNHLLGLGSGIGFFLAAVW